MPKKADIKAVAAVVVGVIVAGYIMQQFRDVSVINDSRNGYGA